MKRVKESGASFRRKKKSRRGDKKELMRAIENHQKDFYGRSGGNEIIMLRPKMKLILLTLIPV